MSNSVVDFKYCGPSRGVCAVCGREIGSYESRFYGDTGAVHIWEPDQISTQAKCRTDRNADLYPHYYTDG